MNANAELPRTLKEGLSEHPDVIYTETAFQGEMESETFGSEYGGPSGCKALPNNTHCHEYLAIDVRADKLADYKDAYLKPVSLSQAKYSAKVERKIPVKEPAAYYFYNVGLVLTFWVKVLKWLAAIFAGFGVISIAFTIIIFILIDGFSSIFDLKELSEFLRAFMLFSILPASVYFLLTYLDNRDLLVRFNKVPRVRLALRRDTGMVQFKKKDRFVDVSFSEVLAMTRTIMGTDGVRRLFLHLSHKHSELSEGLDTGVQGFSAYTAEERWIYHLRWEFYRHYMDVSRPLPDVPEFEPYRHLDPTTREWDKRHGRPQDYWLNMDQETYKAMVDAAMEKAEAYPYDDPDSIDEIGWTPAGDGKAWYQLG